MQICKPMRHSERSDTEWDEERRDEVFALLNCLHSLRPLNPASGDLEEIGESDPNVLRYSRAFCSRNFCF